MLEYLHRLFADDAWANREVLAALSAAGAPTSRSVKLLAHILSAENIWFERPQSRTQSLPVWPDFSPQQCQALQAKLADEWANYLRDLTEAALNRSITYKNSKGESWDSRVEDVLMHVITHSAYHRGQIATDFRAAGLTPPYTDFIHAVRQSLVE
jgi:uncharacterized damage-inducible protein DinB